MKEYLEKYSTYLLAATVLLGVGLIFLFQRPAAESSTPDQEVILSTSQTTESTTLEEQKDSKLFVDVKGAVNNSGMYQVNEGARLLDAVELAGGFTAEADQTRMNFAKLLVDQEVIYVPKVGEELPEQAVVSAAGGTVSSSSTENKINLNTADEQQLQELSGIGEKRAQDIIKYREENGSFQAIEDLTKVSGIGEKTLDNLRDMVTIK